MESDKENHPRLKAVQSRTRIPLPIEPLPPLPQHLVGTKKRLLNEEFAVCTQQTNKRHPLRTLSTQPQPGPSKCTRKPKKQKADTRYVTKRQKDENLDLGFIVFEDDSADEEVITISDDEGEEKKELRYFVENKKKNCLEEARTADTPALETNRVGNIKRSLKRPHSRKLLGLSPCTLVQKKGKEKVKRKLHYNEEIQESLMSPDFLNKSYMSSLCREDYTSDIFKYLLGAEQRKVVPELTGERRACVINWLMRVNGHNGNPAIIQTAIWYLDAVLCFGQVVIEKLQLIAATCYWIAHKLHGPALSASRLVKYSNHAFSTDWLIAAEMIILKALEFPTQPIIAQEYITYLSWWVDNEHPGEIEVAATFICISGLMVDKSLCTECPSVIGAGAVRNALLLLRKRDLLIKLQLCPVYRTAEKKTANMSTICSIQRRAIRTIGTPTYEYRTPFEFYGTPPHYIAQRVINVANLALSNK